MSEETAAPEEQQEIDPFALFDPKIRTAVEGLTFLGYLTDHIEFAGHTWDIKTLLPSDKMAISLALQPYRNTIHEVDVYQWLHIGLAITAVDGHQDWCQPIGPDLTDLAKARLNYVSQKWYPPVCELIWNRYVLLEATSQAALNELDRLSKRGQPTNSPPWLDSLTEQGHSDEQTSSDTQPFIPFKDDSPS